VKSAAEEPVFSAGGHCFTWAEVIEAARVRGDWAALQSHVAGLLARERALAVVDALPSAVQTRAVANAFRFQLNLVSGDELRAWLTRRDISVGEWMAEMRRSLLQSAEQTGAGSPDALERASWVHAVCTGKLAAYARTLAEEVAVQLNEQPLGLTGDELAALPHKREQFCASQLREPALAAAVADNTFGWTRLDLRCLIHSDEMVVREAALCVRLDGRELDDVAVDAGASLVEMTVLLDDADPALRTRLVAANPGDLLGPLATGTDHRLVLVLARVAPSLPDPLVRSRAEQTVIGQALATEVNRHVNWHEHI
jgi:hypothetical protein